jgi:hypothetical protein
MISSPTAEQKRCLLWRSEPPERITGVDEIIPTILKKDIQALLD